MKYWFVVVFSSRCKIELMFKASALWTQKVKEFEPQNPATPYMTCRRELGSSNQGGGGVVRTGTLGMIGG